MMSKVFGVFSVLFFGLFTFLAGSDAAHHWYQSMTVNLFLAAFWAAIGVMQLMMWSHEHAHDIIEDFLDDSLEEILKDLSERFEIDVKVPKNRPGKIRKTK